MGICFGDWVEFETLFDREVNFDWVIIKIITIMIWLLLIIDNLYY